MSHAFRDFPGAENGFLEFGRHFQYLLGVFAGQQGGGVAEKQPWKSSRLAKAKIEEAFQLNQFQQRLFCSAVPPSRS